MKDSTGPETQKQEQALAPAKSEPKTTVITTPEEYHTSMVKWQREKYHILTPMTHVGHIPSHLGLVPSTVFIDADPENGEVYQDKLFCDDDEVAMARPALGKIALAAGLDIRTYRVDPRTIPFYWEVQATATFIGVDGRKKVRQATADYDLRDASPRISKIVKAAQRGKRSPDAQIEGARQYGLRGCETRAINAVIRLVLGLRQKYQKADLKKPFVAVSIVYQPDMSNPVVAKAVTDHMLAGTSMMYDQSMPAAALPAAEPIGAFGTGAEPAPATVVEPVTGQHVSRVAADPEAGLYSIWFEGDDTEYFTKHQAMADLAVSAKKNNQEVIPTIRENEEDGMLFLSKLEVNTAPTPAAPAAETKDTDYIADVKVITRGKNPKGVEWILHSITTKSGKSYGTFDAGHARDAQAAKEKGWPVIIVPKPNERDPSKLDVERLTVLSTGGVLREKEAGE